MSSHYVSAAWKFRTGNAGLKLVLLKLAENANDEGFSWWGQKTLAPECEMSRSTVQRKLDGLRDLGVLEVVPRKRDDGGKSSNGYRLLLPLPEVEASPASRVRHPPPHGYEAAEPKANPKAKEPTAAGPPTKKERPRDPYFDAVATACGKQLASLTNTASREVGVARAEIVAALRREGVPEDEWVNEIGGRARAYRRKHPTWELTPSSLKKWWPELAAVRATPPCPECGIGGGVHLADCSRRA